MGMISAIDPDAARQLRGAALNELVGGAAPQAGSGTAVAGATLSPAKFSSAAMKHEKRIEALFQDDPAALAAWKKAVKVAQRIGDTAGTGEQNSQTAAMIWFNRLMGVPGIFGAGAGAAYSMTGDTDLVTGMTAGALGAKLLKVVTTRRLMKILNDREQTNLLLGLVQPKPGTTNQQLTRMATQLVMESNANEEESR